MEMLAIFGVCAVVAAVAGFFGWQQGRAGFNPNYVPQIQPPGPEGVPVRAPNLTGDEPCCR